SLTRSRLLLEERTGLWRGAGPRGARWASPRPPLCVWMITLRGDFSPGFSADCAGGLRTASINTVIRMNPPSIKRAVSSQTVRVSSSMETPEQAQVDLEPEVGPDAQQRGVERQIHAVHDRGDHRLDL